MKNLSNEEIEEYRNALLEAERSIETALQTMDELELNDDTDALWTNLNRAYALVQTCLRQDHLLRNWED